MKKSSYIAMLLGTVSGVLFALGMCMALIREWNSFGPGVALGCAGVLLGLVTVGVWRKMEHKEPIRISGKAILTVVVGIAGALALGLGMCFTMVWGKLAVGIVVGLGGVVVLLSLIPLTKGIKD
ncbi:MAG: hypothetical protein V8T45_11790 [Oscillospiraceae bacterium]